MHQISTKRIYVGGLASDVSSEEIYERFSRFGKVSNLSLTKRTDELLSCSGSKFKTFAHLDLEGDETNIKKCFSTYQNAKWKGSVLQLQFAKESFLKKLEKEREEALNQKEDILEVKSSSSSQTIQPEQFKVKGSAVPGTPVPGKKDWVVGKYGRVLPVLKLKKSYKIKMVKYDPSKHCHAAKVFKDDMIKTSTDASCDQLTWEINTPDNEITKKRKGEFPEVPQSSKKAKVVQLPPDYSRKTKQMLPNKKENDDLEIVKIGSGNRSLATKINKSNRFDSDAESGSEDGAMFSDAVTHLQSKEQNVLTSMSQLASKRNDIKNVSPAYMNINGHKSTLKLATNKSNVNKLDNTIRINKAKTTPKPAIKGNDLNKKIVLKNSKVTSASEVLADNTDQGSPSAGSKHEIFGEVRKVPEFKGLGMLGLLQQCNSDSDNRQIPVSTPIVNAVSNERTLPLGVDSKPSLDEPGVVSKFSGLSSLSGVPKAVISSSSPLKQKEKLNQSQKTSSLCSKNKMTPLENAQLSSSVLSNDISDSLKEESVSKSYDSASSADTDEIIARCRKSKGLTSKSLTTLRPSSSSDTRKNQFPTQHDLGKTIRNSLVDHSLDLSEFAADITNETNHSASIMKPAKRGDSSDSYDSDMDSNDFELVAKKLAQKAMSSKSDITEKKVLDSKTKEKNSMSVGQNIFNQGQQKKNKLTLTTVQVAGHAAQVNNKSSVHNSITQSKQATDNEKRLRAIGENMKLRQQQQNINVLKNVDSKDGTLGKRIVFSSSSSEDDASDVDQSSKVNKSGLELFDSHDEEEDYEEIFKSKPHFEGKKGEKLMKLEQKIGDPRFKLDAKFADSDTEDEETDQIKKPSITKDVENSLEEEKNANLKVLENVIGKTTLDRFSERLKRNTKTIIDMNTVRFDPTKVQNKTEAMSGGDKKLSQNRIAVTAQDHASKQIVLPSKMREEQTLHKTDNKSKKQEEKNDMVKGSDKEKVQTSLKKHEVKLKSEKSQMRSDEESVGSKIDSVSDKTVSSSKIQMSSALVDIFKKKNENNLDDEDTEAFSLLKQFDEEDSYSEEDGGSDKDKRGAPLSALFKKEAKKTEVICENKTAPEHSRSMQSKETSFCDVMSEDDTGDDEEEMLEESREQVEKTEKVESRVYLPDDNEDSEEESQNIDDRSHLPDGDIDVALINAGKVDVRFTQEQWLRRWEDIRPALITMYKRKHKDALRNKRKQNEINRKKEFLKNSRRNRWTRKRVS